MVDDGPLAGWRWVYFGDPDGLALELVQVAYYPEEGARARFIQTPIVGEMTDPAGNIAQKAAKKSSRAR